MNQPLVTEIAIYIKHNIGKHLCSLSTVNNQKLPYNYIKLSCHFTKQKQLLETRQIHRRNAHILDNLIFPITTHFI